jgi:hypothetical protein
MLFLVRLRVVYVAAAACVVFLLAISAAVSTVRAQSGEPDAPWQAHPCEGQCLPRPTHPCDGDKPCRIGCGSRRDSGNGAECGEESCEEECNPATDWLRVFEPHGQFSFQGGYLAWWTKKTDLPPLATTNLGVVPPKASAGILPGATILFGGDDGDPGMHSGGRFALGYWFTPSHETGIDIVYTFLSNTAAKFDADSQEYPILARPFFDVAPGVFAQDRYLLAYPGGQKGEIHISNAQELNFVEILLRSAIIQECGRNFDFVYGYRYGRFGETLEINDSTNLPNIQKTDLFDAQNEFNGFEMGFVSTTRYCRWSLDVLMKLALGSTRSRMNVFGQTVANNKPTSGGGLLALSSTNVGITERDSFSAIPELGMTLGYNLTRRLKATFGYTFVYWSAVMRPGDQIDTNVNILRVPPGQTPVGLAEPERKSVMTDFWAQGFNIGLDYRF